MENKTTSAVIRRGKRVNFTLLQKERHLENCLRWVNDEEVNKWLLIGAFPITRRQEEEWFDKDPGKENAVFAVETSAGRYIGNVGLHRINWQSRAAELGIVIGEKDEWGKGYATEIEKMMIGYGFRTLGLRKIHARVFAENIASRRALEKNGFVLEGVLKKQEFRHGEFRDILMFAVFNDKP